MDTFSSNSTDRTHKTTAYLRVSTIDQDLEKNKMEILKLANALELGHVTFVEEKISGAVSWKKRKIGEIMESAHKGDNVLVSELSRLGRSMLDIMELLSIATEKGINIYSVKGSWRLDTSIQSKIIAMAFAMASEIEKDLISKRTKEALMARKAAGVQLGRPRGVGKSKLDIHRVEIESLLKTGSTQVYIANRYGTTAPNLNNWLKKHKIMLNSKIV